MLHFISGLAALSLITRVAGSSFGQLPTGKGRRCLGHRAGVSLLVIIVSAVVAIQLEQSGSGVNGPAKSS